MLWPIMHIVDYIFKSISYKLTYTVYLSGLLRRTETSVVEVDVGISSEAIALVELGLRCVIVLEISHC